MRIKIKAKDYSLHLKLTPVKLAGRSTPGRGVNKAGSSIVIFPVFWSGVSESPRLQDEKAQQEIILAYPDGVLQIPLRKTGLFWNHGYPVAWRRVDFTHFETLDPVFATLKGSNECLAMESPWCLSWPKRIGWAPAGQARAFDARGPVPVTGCSKIWQGLCDMYFREKGKAFFTANGHGRRMAMPRTQPPGFWLITALGNRRTRIVE